MLRWSAVFFIIAIFAAVLGFTGLVASAATIGKILFGIFIGLFILALILGITIFKKNR